MATSNADEDDSVRLIQPEETSNSHYSPLSANLSDKGTASLRSIDLSSAPASVLNGISGGKSDEEAGGSRNFHLPQPGAEVQMKEIVAGNVVDHAPVNQIDPEVAAFWLKYVTLCRLACCSVVDSNQSELVVS